MFKTTHVLFVVGILVALLVGGVGGFVWGRHVGLSEQLNIRTEFFQQRAAVMSGAPSGTPSDNPQGIGTRGAFAQGRQLVNGVVKNVEGNTITVTQQRDGATTTLTVDDKTIIEKTTSGTLADIKPGWRITAFEQTVGGTTTRRIVLTSGP